MKKELGIGVLLAASSMASAQQGDTSGTVLPHSERAQFVLPVENLTTFRLELSEDQVLELRDHGIDLEAISITVGDNSQLMDVVPN